MTPFSLLKSLGALALLGSLSANVVSQQNLLTNSSFENGSNSWNFYGGAERVNNNAQSGSWSAKLGNGNGAEQRVTGLQPNTTYTLTGWGKSNGSQSALIGVKHFGGNETFYVFKNSSYTQGSVTFTTGFGATAATIYVYKSSGNDAAYLDNLSLSYTSESPYKMVWSDEFNGNGAFDSNKWGYETGFQRNKELQWYQPENAYQQNGNLVIEGRKETRPNPDYDPDSDDWRKSRRNINYTSASLTSKKSGSWKYGRIVVRAKVTNFQGTWPAIWTLGTSCEWPSNGEVDIMENYGGKILANYAWGTNTRWSPKWDGSSKNVSELGSGWTNDFHIWELDWNEDRMTISMDGRFMNDVQLKSTFNGSAQCEGQNPFRQSHYILINLALGGDAGGSVANLSFPTQYLIDYVRVYQTSDPGSGNTQEVEAEDASLNGSAQVYSDAIASGGQGVAYLSEIGAGMIINNAPFAEEVKVRYASENSGAISIYVNGLFERKLNFNSTGGWVGSYSEANLNVTVPLGASFEIRYDNGDTPLNVDKVTFISSGNPATPTPSPSPVPTTTPISVPTSVPTLVPTPSPTPTVVPTPQENYYFISHKPSKFRMHSCSTVEGTAIQTAPESSAGNCVQWRRVSAGEYFFLENRLSRKYIRPDTSANGSSIVIQPNTWTGNWTQWRWDDRGDGYGHLVNRATGKHIYADMNSPGLSLQLQPASWRGNLTRWQFIPVP